MTRGTSSDEIDRDEIEFLTPRSDMFPSLPDGFRMVGANEPVAAAFGDVDDEPRSRASTVLAGIGLLALIAVGVVAAAPWSSSDEQTAPPPTVRDQPPMTSERTPIGDDQQEDIGPITPSPFLPDGDPNGDPDLQIVDPFGPGYVVVRPPTGMQPAGAQVQAQPSVPSARLDIWSTSDADRVTGTWLAVSATDSAADELEVVAESTVVDITGVAGLVAMSADGVTTLTWRPRSHVRIELAAHGIALDRLLATAATVVVTARESGGGGFTSAPNISYVTPPVADDDSPLQQIVGEDRDSADLGAQVAQFANRFALYRNGTGEVSLVLATRDALASDEAIARFLLATATTATGTPVARQVSVNGLDVSVGALPNNERASVVQWREDDDWITAIALVPIDRLIRSLRTVRLATDAEWTELLRDGRDVDSTGGANTPFVTIGSGEVAGRGWAAAYSQDVGYFVLNGEEFYFSDSILLDPARPVRTYRTIESTFVVVLADPSAGDTLVIRRDGVAPIEVDLVAMPDGEVAVAVAAFEGGAAFTAEIVTAPQSEPAV